MNRNEETALKKINKILNELAMSCDSVDSYQVQCDEYFKTAGLSVPPAELKRHYTHFREKYTNHEKHVRETATALVKRNENVHVSLEMKKQLGINDIGESIAEGPHLTILDGGPGAGKSFSLGKAMDAMGAPVICLGATKSAAAGLFKDMDEIRSNHVKKNEQNVPILGGMTVESFLAPQTPEEKKQKAQIDACFAMTNPPPVFMVDEAGLLGHKEMDQILNYAAAQGVKIILAGDSQQIPPEKGVPFKMLTESLKDTPAYVNAPYVFRQGDFVDKAITSGVYHGFTSDQMDISQKVAAEFMTAAYDVGDPKFSDRSVVNDKGEKKDFSFKDYMTEKYPDLDKKEAVARYVSELNDKRDEFFGGSEEKMLDALQTGPKTDNYDKYVCAALICQSIGVRAYELRGMMKTEENVTDSVARDFADNYMHSLREGQIRRQTKEMKTAKAENRKPKIVGPDYADGQLAITATKEEARELNDSIRKALGKEGGLTAGEPIILSDGKRVLASAEQAQNPPPGFSYAYALDVTTTQGMSQNGKVIMVVQKETQNNLQGGEILVGATRHKGKFEIKLSADADKGLLFANSANQFASARLSKDPFDPLLYLAAKGAREKIPEKQKAADENRKQSVKGLHSQIQRKAKQVDPGIKQQLEKRQLTL